MANPFVHLHVHSEYSLLDGLSKIPKLITRAQELGQPAVALTDHGGNLYIYDWRTNELRDKHMLVGRLVQWRQDLGVFVVMRAYEHQEYYTWADSWLETVAP